NGFTLFLVVSFSLAVAPLCVGQTLFAESSQQVSVSASAASTPFKSVAQASLRGSTREAPVNYTDPDLLRVAPVIDEETDKLKPQEREIRHLLKDISDLIDQNRVPEAEVKLKQLEALKPDSASILSIRAAIAVYKGNQEEASLLYQELINLIPKAFEPRFNLAELLMLDKKYEEARDAFTGLLKQFPDNPLLMYKIVLSCLMEKKYQEVQKWLGRLSQLPPSPFSYYGFAAANFSQGKFLTGRQFILEADKKFGPGKLRWLHRTLEDTGLAIPGDYPPQGEK
ncbi:MAG: tetratricopeptide repeat protein, partial [Verrucomicrobiota bacterium]